MSNPVSIPRHSSSRSKAALERKLVLRAPRPALLLGLWLEPPAAETAGGDGPWWPLGGLPLLAVLAWWRLRRAPGYHG